MFAPYARSKLSGRLHLILIKFMWSFEDSLLLWMRLRYVTDVFHGILGLLIVMWSRCWLFWRRQKWIVFFFFLLGESINPCVVDHGCRWLTVCCRTDLLSYWFLQSRKMVKSSTDNISLTGGFISFVMDLTAMLNKTGLKTEP